MRFIRGLYLPELDLWLDPGHPKPPAFISHAHADHFARHEAALCSEVSPSLLHVTCIKDNASLLYTGEFKTRRGRTAEPVSYPAADTLSLETTFGQPIYVFPNQMGRHRTGAPV